MHKFSNNKIISIIAVTVAFDGFSHIYSLFVIFYNFVTYLQLILQFYKKKGHVGNWVSFRTLKYIREILIC